jgi:hypothetical protein
MKEMFRNAIRTVADLTPDQNEAVEFMHANPFSALFLDVGFGKTAISLTVLRRLIVDEHYHGKILIIAPIRVATRVWPQEPGLWTHLCWMRPLVLRVEDDDPRLLALPRAARTAEKRRLRAELIQSPEQIHVIDYHAVDWLVAECAKTKKWPYRVVVFDESSRLRDHNSVVFKALKKVRPYVTRFHELTATPASQTYMHLFSQVWLLDKGERFGNGITAFRERYFTFNPYVKTWKIRDGAKQEIERLISDICLVKRRERDFRVVTRTIRLPEPVMRAYEEFEDECVLQLADDRVIDGVNAAVLCSKLLQYASGFVYDENGTAASIHDEKLLELRSLYEETIDQPILVAYWFRESLERIREAFPDAVSMDREGKIVDAWNRGEHKMLLVHPQSAGHGLNLQQGGHHVVAYDLWYSLELFLQTVGRLDRPGQTAQVMVHLLSARGTIDELVAANLQRLRSAEDAMFERLRRRAEGLLSGPAGAGRARQPVQIPRADTVPGEGADAFRYPA